MPEKADLTERQLSILRKLFAESKVFRSRRIEKNQSTLAAELGITRQALSAHFRELRRLGLLRTGRGFIDLTEKATRILGEPQSQAFVLVKIEPRKRRAAYEEIKNLDVQQAFRVTGSVDVIVLADRLKLNKLLEALSRVPGVKETSAHLVLAPLVRE
jgi:DNA-binding Lrp family transcriptional regulator